MKTLQEIKVMVKEILLKYKIETQSEDLDLLIFELQKYQLKKFISDIVKNNEGPISI